MKVTPNPDGTLKCELTKPEHAKLLAARAIVDKLGYHLPSKTPQSVGQLAQNTSTKLLMLATLFDPNPVAASAAPPEPDAKEGEE